MDIRKFKESTFEAAKEHVLSHGLRSLKKDDDDFFCEILMSGCLDLNEKVGLLVSSGVDVNAQTAGFPSEFTALARIVKKEKHPHELIDLLLTNGADIEAPSTLSLTPLHCAIILQNLELVKYLISKGADPNAICDNGFSCLMLALSSNDEYENRRFYWPFYDISGGTKRAVNIEILDELVLSGAKLDYQAGWRGSVLEVAVRTGKTEVIDWLLKHGVKPNDTVSSGSSKTLLMSACESGALPVINHLLERGADVDAVDNDGQTALFYASDKKVAKALLDAGASLTHLDKNGRSLFQRPYCSVEIFQNYGKEFVRLGGDVNARAADGRSVLHLLADSYYSEGAIKLAISLGCDVNAQDQNGTTPLMLARSEYWQELVAAGARVNDADANGDHALNLHLSSDLLEFGADVNWANGRGQTPLMLAAQKGDVSLVKALLKAGAGVDAIDQEGKMATDYADVKALRTLVEAGAPLNPESTSALATAITGKNASLSRVLLRAGLKARLSDVQVKGHLALLENIAQEDLDLFREGIVGDGEKADKLIAKIITARNQVLEAAKALPVCGDEDLPEVLRPGVWPRKAEAPKLHLKVAMPSNDGRLPIFSPPEVFDERMSSLHDDILTDISSWEPAEQKSHRKEKEKEILKLCKRHKTRKSGLSSWDIYENRLDVDDFLFCSDGVILQLWNDCFDILSDMICSYSRKISDKSKYEFALYRLRGEAFEGIRKDHCVAIQCLSYFDAIEVAPVMAQALGRLSAQTWLKRFPDTAITGLLACAFGEFESDRSDAQQALRWLSTQGFRGKIEETAKRYGTEALAAALAFLDRSDEADFLPKKLTKLPSYFVASAHPAPILKESGKALPVHAVETIGRMMLASTCHLQTPALIKVMEVCDRESLADFALSAYDSWVKNGAKKDGIGFLHALGYMGDARAAALLVKNYRNAPFYPATAAAIDVLGALGTNTAISGLQTIMRFSKYDKAQAYAQEVIENIAEARGLAPEMLEDLAVPDLGLEHNSQMTLDFGPRRFSVTLDSNLDAVLTDENGNILKALPKATKSDNALLAKAATAQWKEFKSALKGQASDQKKRFEKGMLSRREWLGATFKEVIAVHPLLSKMVRSLVWATLRDQALETTFRIDAEGRYVAADGKELSLDNEARVTLPHPCLFGDNVEAWLQIFADNKLTQPFPQLARKWFLQGPQTENLISKKDGTKVPLGALRGLKAKGWEFEEGGAGMVWSVYKSDEGARASIDVEPGWSLSGFDYEDFGGDQTVKLDVSGSDPIAYSELVRDFLSLPVATGEEP
ncbi:ankyrin repeat domain-containing protein [Erythrobacter aurantius]|uniref:ankyrin repeat domain-containing protein n=1 Tax=Erythrobacter aurantius TaxID=2909249 RepID=UPI00207993A4|nr:ankyrin repeat domain-containing protein [Erythrobacter aurantius]